MPTITEYVNPDTKLQPSDRGSDARVQAGRRVAGFSREQASGLSEVASSERSLAGDMNRTASSMRDLGNDTASSGRAFARDVGEAIQDVGKVAVAYEDHREISKGAATYAQMNQTLTEKWNEAAKNADPNDPTTAKKFQEEVLEPTLQNFKESFGTENSQKWAESQIASLRNHMFEKTSADMSVLAGEAVKVNAKQMSNSFSNTAYSDPTSVPHLLKSVDSSVGAMVDSSPNIKGATGARVRMEVTQHVKEEIVKSAAIGAIAKSSNPEATAEAFGKQYPEFISGGELKMLAANARQQSRAQRIDEKYLEGIKDKEAEARSDEKETRYLQSVHSDDPRQQSQVSSKAIVNDPELSLPAKRRLISVVEREMKPETQAQISNGNAMDLLQRIRAPDGSPDRINNLDDIYKARIDGKLNKTDFDMLRKEFADVRTPEGERLSARKTEFLKAVQPSIDGSNPLMGKIDKDGKLNSYRLMTDLDKRIDEYRKAGKNPYDLLDPAKPDFMGTPASLQPYQKPLQDSIRDQARKMTGGTGKNITGPNTTITGVEVTNAPVAPPVVAPKIEPRKPGESPMDYLKRTGS